MLRYSLLKNPFITFAASVSFVGIFVDSLIKRDHMWGLICV